MKKFTRIGFLLLIPIIALAQDRGNAWIDHSQQYFKFPLHQKGLYRIDSVTLASRYNLTSTDPRNFQLFLEGKEQYLYIEGEADGKINTGDFIEFYAEPSTLLMDSLLYTHIRYMPNPYAPIFNDTIYAFLTLNNSLNNKRFQTEIDTNSALYPSAQYCYGEQLHTVPANYNYVEDYIQGAPGDPRYKQAEGRGQIFTGNSFVTVNFNPIQIYTNTALPVYLTLNTSGASKNFASAGNDHQLKFDYLDAGLNPVQLFDTIYYGYIPIRKTFTLNATQIGPASNFTISSPISSSLTVSANQTMLHYLKMVYPQVLNFNNSSVYKFYADDISGSGKGFYNFLNFNTTGSASVILLDLDNGKRIRTVLNPPYVRAVVPNGSGRKNCAMIADKDTLMVPKLIPANITGTFTDFQTQDGGKVFVIIYHKSLQSSAITYANYRKSSSGGSYNVISADIQELYEQFAHGINKHPSAIRNFLGFLSDSLNSKPAYVFLIGKGIEPQYLGPAQQNENLVPTMGIPSSDHLLSASLQNPNGNFLVQDIPIGRLAALNNSEVNNYLLKVQQHESSAQADWKKQVLHFIGSNNDYELGVFSSYMDLYKQFVQDTVFGGHVSSFSKNTSSPVQNDLSDSIYKAMSKGAALINFFGHGATQNLGIAIEDPNKFQNQGRYSFFIANSCYSGNIFVHGLQASVSHNYVFANQRGSIGYIATTSLSYENRLHRFSQEFYKAFSKTNYNKAIGEIIRTAAQNNSGSADSLTKFIGLQEVLHGDPSIRIGNGDQPDYVAENADLKFDLKTYSDSIGIRIQTINLGKAVADSFLVYLKREFPGGDTSLFLIKTKAPYYKDSIRFFIPLDFNRGIGLNKFYFSIDQQNTISESNENNNSSSGSIDLLIAGNDLSPVYPFPYAIVPKTNTITLKASTSDPFAPEGSYIFQLDTNGRFISALQSTTITSKGGVLEWTVNLPFADSTVYYWRVSRDSVSAQKSYSWKTSSFQTIGSKRGWSQAHLNQFRENKNTFIHQNFNTRRFEFESSRYALFCRTGNAGTSAFPQWMAPENINYYFNGIKMSEFSCAPNGWNFVVFDSISAQPLVHKSTQVPPYITPYNSCMCAPQDLYFFSFGATNFCGLANWKNDMESFLNNIAANHYVLAYSIGFLGSNSQVSTYSSSLKSAFHSIGANISMSAADTLPRIIFGRKGMNAGEAHETIGTHYASVVTQNDSISTRWYQGSIASTTIGPSSNWGSLHWKFSSLDLNAGDSIVLKLVGISNSGSIDTLYSFNQQQNDIPDLGNYIQANQHPYLKLVAFLKDRVYRTCPQLERWQVIYEEAGECALNPLKGFKALNDTLMEGDNVAFVIPIENIGQTVFKDSLLLTYWMEDANYNQTALPDKLSAKGFSPGTIIFDTLNLNSYQLSGDYALWIYANPIGKSAYQKEYHQFNNIGRFPFKVNNDITNPLLDITFDGRRILNGDLVSSKPSIKINVKDENKFLALNDTSAFDVRIQRPGQSVPEKLHFDKDLVFSPASLPKNSASVLFEPVFTTDGTYTLIAQAKDRSDNNSGTNSYKVLFEIKQKPSVTSVLNYPNPFSSSTRFVFTLTGSEIPEIFTIQIMTISGKLVREIRKEELGDIHIGRNISAYAWDGKDEYGDKLGNGVYLYRVITRLNGNTMEKSSTEADQFFKKEFGKMVIMR